LFESLPAAAVTCATPPARLPPSPLSTLHPPHLTRVLAGARLAFDLACVMSMGDSVLWLSRGVGVR